MPWDPLRELVAFRDRASERHAGAWAPPVDVYETPDRFVLVAELPGFTPDDVSVSATPGSLTLSGRRPPLAVDVQQYLRIERGQGDFSRTFSFPEAIAVGAIAADFRDGLLTITVPKADVAAPRRIDVR